MSTDRVTIDGFGPLPVARPGSAAELGELVRAHAADGRAVYPVGGGTQLHVGLPPTRPGTAVGTLALDRLIDYPARDMTITVQAGVTVARLEEILRSENQRLPVDVPFPDRATLGGAVAANSSGPRRFGWGTFRDHVIGVSLVNDEGHETRAGGRVVKNVAGYDLMKLYTGSFGTLGVVTQLTLKLRPRPETTAFVARPCQPDALPALLDSLNATRSSPAAVELLNAAAARAVAAAAGVGLPESPWLALVGFEEKEETVAWQAAHVQGELGGETVVYPAAEADRLWAALRDHPADPSAGLTFRANLVPSAAAAFCRQAAEVIDGVRLQAHVMNGVVTGHAPSDFSLTSARAVLALLGRTAVSASGNLRVPRCPTAWKADVPVWGEARGDRPLMRAVKAKLDPRGVFNPGRFISG